MGSGMTHALLTAGFDVTVWNRTPAWASLLASEGAAVADSVASAVEGADVVITMVFDADAVEQVARQMAPHFPADAVWLQMSTIGVEGVKRAQRVAEEFGLALIDAPVLGTKAPANNGTLVVLAAGDPQLIERTQPVLEALSAKVVRAGETIGDASALKLVCNMWIASLTAGLAQSLAFASALKLDPSMFLEAITGGTNDTPFAHVKGASMLADEFPTSFAVASLLKDIGLARNATASTSVNTELAETLEHIFKDTDQMGFGGEDIAAIYRDFLRPAAATGERAPQQ
jgi:3-hydroxyisobutyrate dehydrogenase